MEKTGRDFAEFLKKVERYVLSHEVIVNNRYTKIVKVEGFNTAQIKDLYIQFSVFSKGFIPIEAKRYANATDEEAEEGSRKILGNELGVPLSMKKHDIEGGRFSHKLAHINWLRKDGEDLGIPRMMLGDWRQGTPLTLEMLDGLEFVYGSRDKNISDAASFAVESWAAYGIGKGEEAESNNFWQELIVAINKYSEKYRVSHDLKPLDISFFQYHYDIEVGHREIVEAMLRGTFYKDGFDEGKWLEGGSKALDAVHKLWIGLHDTYMKLEGATA